MATPTRLMSPRASILPVKLASLPTRTASSAAVKKVLSPNSPRKTILKAARHPCWLLWWWWIEAAVLLSRPGYCCCCRSDE
jgi:hypothetical protein